MTDPIRILLLSGSSRPQSHTFALTSSLARRLERQAAVTTHWVLAERPLPPPDPSFHGDPREHPDPRVRELVSAADVADGFVLGTPVYHNSYSSTLKSALDHLAIAQFWYKPLSLVSHGGHRSSQAIDQVRLVARGLQAIALPAQVCTADEDYEQLMEGYEVSAPAIEARLDRVAAELARFTTCIRSVRRSLNR